MIRSATTTRQRQLAKYARVKAYFLSTKSGCFRCGEYVAPNDRQLHHFYGRTGELLCWVFGFRMACPPCHDWIERHRNDSVRLGYRAPDNLFNRPSLVIPKL